LKLLVYEFFSGGGYVRGEISGLIGEAYAMLRYAVEDFNAAGFEVYTTLDHRIAVFDPPLKAQHVRVIYDSDSNLFEETLSMVDAAFLIAPETDGVLYTLAEEAVKQGVELFGPLPSAIELTSDKSRLLGIAEKLGLRVPRHRVLKTTNSTASIEREAGRVGYPCVFKVLDGAGSEGMSLVSREEEIHPALVKIRSVSERDEFLLEEFVEGVNASVSLISTGESALPLTLNFQSVRVAPPSEESKYVGGYVPLRHKLRKSAFEAAETLVKSVDGLQGYVGVDLILSEEGVTILEVNPRLTTSYLGLRRVLKQNPAEIISQAVTRKILPPRVSLEGCAYFEKIDLPNSVEVDNDKLRSIARYEAVAAPPFPVRGRKHAILVTHAEDEEHARLKMEKTVEEIVGELAGSARDASGRQEL